MVKIKHYRTMSLLIAVFSLCCINLCLGETPDESDSAIFDSEVYHVSFHYPKSLLIPQKISPQANMMYRFQSSLNSNAWLSIRFISPEQASSLTMTCKDKIKAKRLNLDCEAIELSKNLYAYIQYSSRFLIDGQLKAIAWIEHPNGGIIDIQFSPIDKDQTQLFKDIIKSIKLLEYTDN